MYSGFVFKLKLALPSDFKIEKGLEMHFCIFFLLTHTIVHIENVNAFFSSPTNAFANLQTKIRPKINSLSILFWLSGERAEMEFILHSYFPFNALSSSTRLCVCVSPHVNIKIYFTNYYLNNIKKNGRKERKKRWNPV